MELRFFPRLLLVTLVIGVASILLAAHHEAKSSPASSQTGVCRISFPLPNPSEMGVAKFETLLRDFLLQGCYKGWVADSQIRTSGPFINGQNLVARSI